MPFFLEEHSLQMQNKRLCFKKVNILVIIILIKKVFPNWILIILQVEIQFKECNYLLVSVVRDRGARFRPVLEGSWK